MIIIRRDPVNEESFDLQVGAQLVLEMTESGATGYSWHVDTVVPGLFFDENKEYRNERSSESSSVTGGTNVRVLRFNARARGCGQLVVTYRRPWNRETDTVRKFGITISSRGI